MFKKLIIPLVTLVSLSSCSVVESAREKLAQMPEDQFVQLNDQVRDVAEDAGRRLKNLLGVERLDVRNDIAMLAMLLEQVVKSDAIDSTDIAQFIVDRFALNLNLTDEQIGYIQDIANAIDVAVGQISLGIDGKLSEREKTLLLSFLGGLKTGLLR